MPNIEIHGIQDRRSEDIARKIFELTNHKDYRKDVVITYPSSSVLDRDREQQPFLRIVTTEDNIDDVVKTLASIHMDKEVIKLEKFIPA